ncbi:hypothetical protein [Lentzea nigeriaca]|uniref:hypothetical protein n=1 Tax=Lentzea nigeriaca TaxID=1128665 RepID=UPI0019579B66|nr:hypothetical protein [Lentzea nigeriaca]MBM7858283.1 hypothetical protein [Lentzea nigeriaca]
MRSEDTELITEFGKISKLMPNVLFDFVMETLTPERQQEFGEILISLGGLLVNHAEDRKQSEQPTTVDAVEDQAEQAGGFPKRLPS